MEREVYNFLLIKGFLLVYKLSLSVIKYNRVIYGIHLLKLKLRNVFMSIGEDFDLYSNMKSPSKANLICIETKETR